MREALARWWAHRKLHRGQCEWCRRVLLDDQTRFCSDECGLEHWGSALA